MLARQRFRARERNEGQAVHERARLFEERLERDRIRLAVILSERRDGRSVRGWNELTEDLELMPIRIEEIDSDRDTVVEDLVDPHVVAKHGAVEAPQLIDVAVAVHLESDVLEFLAALGGRGRREEGEVVVVFTEREEESAPIGSFEHLCAHLHAENLAIPTHRGFGIAHIENDVRDALDSRDGHDRPRYSWAPPESRWRP